MRIHITIAGEETNNYVLDAEPADTPGHTAHRVWKQIQAGQALALSIGVTSADKPRWRVLNPAHVVSVHESPE